MFRPNASMACGSVTIRVPALEMISKKDCPCQRMVTFLFSSAPGATPRRARTASTRRIRFMKSAKKKEMMTLIDFTRRALLLATTCGFRSTEEGPHQLLAPGETPAALLGRDFIVRRLPSRRHSGARDGERH